MWLYIAGAYLALKYFGGGPKKAIGQGKGGAVVDVPKAEEGGKTGLADGVVTIKEGGGFLVACNGSWWPVGEGLICCKGASGRTLTHGDGQIVCAANDEDANWIWRKVGGG